MESNPNQSAASVMPLSGEIRDKLVAAAHDARQRAYTPYSHYTVGAALLAANGEVFLGCNIENAAYSPTICAERVAVYKAVSEGITKFSAVVVVTENGGAPCGPCRQVMYEFAPDMLVICMDSNGQISFEGPLRELLPHGFGPEFLNHDATS